MNVLTHRASSQGSIAKGPEHDEFIRALLKPTLIVPAMMVADWSFSGIRWVSFVVGLGYWLQW